MTDEKSTEAPCSPLGRYGQAWTSIPRDGVHDVARYFDRATDTTPELARNPPG